MNVQMNCQPIKPVYGSVATSRPAFRGVTQEDIDAVKECGHALGLDSDAKAEGWKCFAKGAFVAWLAYYSIAKAAPDVIKHLTKIGKTVLNMSIVKKPALFVRDKAVALGKIVKNSYDNIKPETKLGKVKEAIAKPCSWVKQRTYDPIAKRALEYIKNNNIDAPWAEDMLVKSLGGVSALAAFAKTTGLTEPIEEQADSQELGSKNVVENMGDEE